MTAAVTDLYMAIGMYKGFPRVLKWEQTKAILPNCAGVDATVDKPNTGAGNAPRWDMAGMCQWVKEGTSSDKTICPPKAVLSAGSLCGFNTFTAKFTKGVFAGFLQEGSAHDCAELMCGKVVDPLKRKDTAPPQLFLTWAGTDKNDNNLVSKGLSFASFKQYSAFELYTKASAEAK